MLFWMDFWVESDEFALSGQKVKSRTHRLMRPERKTQKLNFKIKEKK